MPWPVAWLDAVPKRSSPNRILRERRGRLCLGYGVPEKTEALEGRKPLARRLGSANLPREQKAKPPERFPGNRPRPDARLVDVVVDRALRRAMPK